MNKSFGRVFLVLFLAGLALVPTTAHAEMWVLAGPQIYPIAGTGNVVVNPSAPLNTWVIFGTLPTLGECQNKKQAVQNLAPPAGVSESVRNAIGVQKLSMNCFSSNNPDLPPH
jgi:hypothetical protein